MIVSSSADVHAHVLVALVGERGALVAVVGEHRVLAVVHLPGGHDLVARVAGERGDRAVELLVDLGGEVLVEQVESTLAEVGIDHAPVILSRIGHGRAA